MRTTLDIDPQLLKQLRSEAQRQGISLKSMLDRVIHRGLAEPKAVKSAAYKCPSFPMGAASSKSLDKALAVTATLEDDETVREPSLRK